MKKTTKFRRSLIIINLIITIGFIIGACNNNESELSAEQMQVTVQSLVKTQLAATAQVDHNSPDIFPTMTPLPVDLTPLYLLISNPQSDQSIANHLAFKINELAVQNQGQFEHHQVSPITHQSVPLAIFLAPADDLILFAETHPETDIVAIDYPIQTDRANITYVSAHSSELENNYAAGLLSAMISDNWRIGILSLENENSKANTFIQGVKKFCGSCTPPENEDLEYPLYYTLSSPNSTQELQNAINQLRIHYVNVVYLTTPLITNDIQSALVQNGFLLAGESNQVTNAQNWTFAFETELSTQMIDDLITQLSTEGAIINHINTQPLTVFNSDLVTEGKINKMDEILHDFKSGFINLY